MDTPSTITINNFNHNTINNIIKKYNVDSKKVLGMNMRVSSIKKINVNLKNFVSRSIN